MGDIRECAIGRDGHTLRATPNWYRQHQVIGGRLDHRNSARRVVGHIGESAIRRDGHGLGAGSSRDGRHDGVRACLNHRDAVGEIHYIGSRSPRRWADANYDEDQRDQEHHLSPDHASTLLPTTRASETRTLTQYGGLYDDWSTYAALPFIPAILPGGTR